MYTATAARNRFSESNIEGASGPRVVVMCFDRLDRDLTLGLEAIGRLDHYEANATLGHAQDLLTELAAMLDTSKWEHGRSLLTIYDYLLRLLTTANMKKDAGMVREAIRHIKELGDAFREAERTMAAPASAAAPTLGTTATGDAPDGTALGSAASPTPSVAARRLSVQA